MKQVLHTALCIAILAGGAVADDRLDAPLAALKKKRQTAYATSAVLHDQDLSVPTDLTAEELALADAMQRMDSKLGFSEPSSINPQSMVQRRIPQRTDSSRNNNWLTPAMLNGESEIPSESPDADWVAAELDRQNQLQMDRNSRNQDSTGMDSWLVGSYEMPGASPADDFQNYNQSFQGMMTAQTSPSDEQQTASTSQYLFSQTDPDPAESAAGLFSLSQQQDQQGSITRFGSQPTSGSGISDQTPSYVSSWESSAPSATGPSWIDQEETEPLRPIDQIRRSSPGYQDDPFSDDDAPDFSSSIWD